VYELLRVYITRGSRLYRLILAEPVELLLPAGVVRAALHSLEKLPQDEREVADYRDIHVEVLSDLGGVYVNMDNCHVVALLHCRNSAVAHSRAHQYERVAGVYRGIRRLAAVHAEHSVEQRRISRDSAQTHHRGNYGDIGLFAHKCRGVAGEKPAAGKDKRLLRLCDRSSRALYLVAVAGAARAVAADIHGLRILEVYLSLLNIERNVYQHRASSAGARDIERALEHLGGVLRALEKVAVLYERLCGACDIRFLENISAYLVGVHLTGDHHHRHGIHIRRCDRRDEVQGAGAAGRDGDCGFAGNAGVAACGMASVDLVADEYMTDICFI